MMRMAGGPVYVRWGTQAGPSGWYPLGPRQLRQAGGAAPSTIYCVRTQPNRAGSSGLYWLLQRAHSIALQWHERTTRSTEAPATREAPSPGTEVSPKFCRRPLALDGVPPDLLLAEHGQRLAVGRDD